MNGCGSIRERTNRQRFTVLDGAVPKNSTSPTDIHNKSRLPDIFVFLDKERSESINDGWLWVVTDGYNSNGAVDMDNLQIADLPAIYHNKCSAFSFADGHCDLHHWIDSDTYALEPEHVQSTPGNDDAAWLMTHATYPTD